MWPARRIHGEIVANDETQLNLPISKFAHGHDVGKGKAVFPTVLHLKTQCLQLGDEINTGLCVGNIIEVKSAVLERDIRDSRLNR